MTHPSLARIFAALAALAPLPLVGCDSGGGSASCTDTSCGTGHACVNDRCVTRTFDAHAPFRVFVGDSDGIVGAPTYQPAIDQSYARFPQALVENGTLTITQGGNRVTLTLTPVATP